MSLSTASNLLNPARKIAPQPGDVINVLVDAIESLGYSIRPGSLDETGLAAESIDGRVIRVALDFDRRDKVGAAGSASPDVLGRTARALTSYDGRFGVGSQ